MVFQYYVDAADSCSAQFLETLDGLTSIRAFGWVQQSLDRNCELVDQAQKPFYLMGMIQKWLALVLDLIIMVMAVLIVGIAVRLRNTISPGFTGVSLTQVISFTSYLTTMILFWAQMETSLSAVARIKDFSQGTEKESSPEMEADQPKGWPARGRIEIDSLCAKYRYATTSMLSPVSVLRLLGRSDAANLVLNNVNLVIEAGEKVCICGRTGRQALTPLVDET